MTTEVTQGRGESYRINQITTTKNGIVNNKTFYDIERHLNFFVVSGLLYIILIWKIVYCGREMHIIAQ